MLRANVLICSKAPALGGLITAKLYGNSSFLVKGFLNRSRLYKVIAPSDASLRASIAPESDGNTDNKGLITVNAGNTATFNGVIGGTKALNTITLAGANSVANFNKDVSATAIITNDATAQINAADGITIKGNVDATVNGGNLVFLGTGKLLVVSALVML